jgi:mannose-6-phosphate isomerase
MEKTKEAFTVLMCSQGQFKLEFDDEITTYKIGDTVLLPANLDQVTFKGKATLLEISI